MCGVPHHSASGYIEQLIEKGYKVAICEQTEDPKQAKGVVRREVVQLITPGTIMDGKGLHAKENNYIAAISHLTDGRYGIACTDFSTGESKVTVVLDVQSLLDELATIGAKEVVACKESDKELLQQMKDRCQAIISYEDNEIHEWDIIDHIILRPELQLPALTIVALFKKNTKT